jgi:hypothetical protein
MASKIISLGISLAAALATALPSIGSAAVASQVSANVLGFAAW